MRVLWDTKRRWLPFVAAALCLFAGASASPIVAYGLLIAAFGFVLDGATLMWPKGDGLYRNKQ